MPLILYFLVSKNINDWMDHQRISDEVESILITVVKDQEEVSRLQSLNDEDQENVDSLKDEMTDSQAIYELIRRFRDEIGKYSVYSEALLCRNIILTIFMCITSNRKNHKQKEPNIDEERGS